VLVLMAGLDYVHFHDLRHVAGTLAAATGAGTKELMYRLGHVSPQAALRYQHATRERDTAIAQAIGTMMRSARPAQRGCKHDDDEDQKRPAVTPNRRCPVPVPARRSGSGRSVTVTLVPKPH
jgi:hypothetical protein